MTDILKDLNQAVAAAKRKAAAETRKAAAAKRKAAAEKRKLKNDAEYETEFLRLKEKFGAVEK